MDEQATSAAAHVVILVGHGAPPRDFPRAEVARLKAQGALVELRRCGIAQRLCVRVDRKAGAFGEGGEFLVVRGY